MPNLRNTNKNGKQLIRINDSQVKTGRIHYSYLVVFLAAFILGIIAILVGKNYINSEVINFSTLDLINFIFSIALSASSIVLAITAIILGKSSEQAIIKQSIESKDLQNEISTKTIEVLSRIESSTGINEKRIDDISRKIADLPRHTGANRENEIREIMRRDLLPVHGNSQRVKDREKLMIEEKKKEEGFKNAILTGIANIEKVIAEKIGEGEFDRSGNELVDGVFSLNEKKFSISTFYIEESDGIFDLFDEDTFRDYFLSLSRELSSGTFSKAFFCFNKKIEEDLKFMSLYKDSISPLKEEVKSGLIIISGTSMDLITKIKKQLKLS